MEQDEKEVVLTDILKKLPGDVKISKSLSEHIQRYMTCKKDTQKDDESIVSILYESNHDVPLEEIAKRDLITYLERRLSDFCYCDSSASSYLNCCGREDLEELRKYLEDNNCVQ